MSIPIKFQVEMGNNEERITEENKVWCGVFMLTDGSLYAIEQTSRDWDHHHPVYPINRSFAGKLLMKMKKLRIGQYHSACASASSIKNDIRIRENRLKEISKETSKGAFNERGEHAREISRSKIHLKNANDVVEMRQKKVAEIENAIQKFKATKKPTKSDTPAGTKPKASKKPKKNSA